MLHKANPVPKPVLPTSDKTPILIQPSPQFSALNRPRSDFSLGAPDSWSGGGGSNAQRPSGPGPAGGEKNFWL
jgi:hypothetical protein